MMISLAYISHTDCLLHEMGQRHPERPGRLAAIDEGIISSGLDKIVTRYDAPLIERALLEAVHGANYVQQLFDQSPAGDLLWLDPDTAMGPHTLAAARRAAGAAVLGVDLVMAGEANRVFCAVRPPGHHAETDRAMGFCFFNNVAVAAYHALANHGLQRIAIADFDVHHCNGTEEIVAGDERILLCSTFQHPFYPHSGQDCRASNVVNVPLAAGADGEAFRRAVEERWLQRLADFEPELILVSAGFDAHQSDPIAELNLCADDYSWVTGKLGDQAERSASGRVVSSLEGGYELNSLARSVEAHLNAMLQSS